MGTAACGRPLARLDALNAALALALQPADVIARLLEYVRVAREHRRGLTANELGGTVALA